MEDQPDQPIESGNRRFVGDGLSRVLLREPTLIISFAYALTALIGVWGSYWYYRQLGVPILEFLQIGDFFTAGLRDPIYIGIGLVSMLLTWLLYIPYGWRFSQPQRYARLRGHWWFRALYPHMPAWSGMHRLRPGIGLAVGMLWTTLGMSLIYVNAKADRIRKDGGWAPTIRIDDGPADAEPPLRLLGTTTAYVFVWRPARNRVEVLPIESITRMALAPVPSKKPEDDTAPAPDPAPAASSPSPPPTPPSEANEKP